MFGFFKKKKEQIPMKIIAKVKTQGGEIIEESFNVRNEGEIKQYGEMIKTMGNILVDWRKASAGEGGPNQDAAPQLSKEDIAKLERQAAREMGLPIPSPNVQQESIQQNQSSFQQENVRQNQSSPKLGRYRYYKMGGKECRFDLQNQALEIYDWRDASEEEIDKICLADRDGRMTPLSRFLENGAQKKFAKVMMQDWIRADEGGEINGK